MTCESYATVMKTKVPFFLVSINPFLVQKAKEKEILLNFIKPLFVT